VSVHPADAQIYDRGYRRYTGERRRTRRAIGTLIWHSMQRALGMRRSVWAKVLPVLIIVISYVPAIVFVGIVALFPQLKENTFQAQLELPSYGEYFAFIASAVVLFVSFVGPELLCTDRRTGMLGLYLASPLTRSTYLLAKAAATAIVLSFITIGPPMFMLLASVMQGVGPDGPNGVAETAGKIVLSGAIASAMFTSISLGIASCTDRKAFATAATLLLFLVTGVMSGVLVASGLGDDFFLINVLRVPFDLIMRIHGEQGVDVQLSNIRITLASNVSTIGIVAATAAWTIGGAVVARINYGRITVAR
jgi:ABC-2 type transport system permease protein